MHTIPEPPAEQVVIPTGEDSRRIAAWVSFFETLSPRIKIFRRTDAGFGDLFARTEKALREERMIEDHYTLVGWPTEHATAFLLHIDSAPPDSSEAHIQLWDTYFFCFEDRAFAPRHFEWDEGEEGGEYSYTYSLGAFTSDLLSWSFISSIIQEKLVELEKRVPPPPE